MSADLYQTIRLPMYGQGQIVAYTGTAGTSAALPPGVSAVWVFCTTQAYVRVNGTATTADLPLPANTGIVLPVDRAFEGNSITVSAVQAAAGGNMHLIPVT